jgi:hypothetical protein
MGNIWKRNFIRECVLKSHMHDFQIGTICQVHT